VCGQYLPFTGRSAAEGRRVGFAPPGCGWGLPPPTPPDGGATLPVKGRDQRCIVDQYALGLRGGAAAHLAICADYGATLCTLDQKLFAAGPALGIPMQMI
jgi:hypothetical protein